MKRINDTCHHRRGPGIVKEELVTGILNEELPKKDGVIMVVIEKGEIES